MLAGHCGPCTPSAAGLGERLLAANDSSTVVMETPCIPMSVGTEDEGDRDDDRDDEIMELRDTVRRLEQELLRRGIREGETSHESGEEEGGEEGGEEAVLL